MSDKTLSELSAQRQSVYKFRSTLLPQVESKYRNTKSHGPDIKQLLSIPLDTILLIDLSAKWTNR